jgi:hypothetical protein
VATGSAYYRGGPRDGQIQLATTDGDYLIFADGPPPWPRYKLTSETITINNRVYPVADHVGTGPTDPSE